MSQETASTTPSRAAPLFATLAQAKKAGWIVRTRNEGPADWVHYSATIYRQDDSSFCEFLVSRDAMWERVDAKRHALEWINDYVANTLDERARSSTSTNTTTPL